VRWRLASVRLTEASCHATSSGVTEVWRFLLGLAVFTKHSGLLLAEQIVMRVRNVFQMSWDQQRTWDEVVLRDKNNVFSPPQLRIFAKVLRIVSPVLFFNGTAYAKFYDFSTTINMNVWPSFNIFGCGKSIKSACHWSSTPLSTVRRRWKLRLEIKFVASCFTLKQS